MNDKKGDNSTVCEAAKLLAEASAPLIPITLGITTFLVSGKTLSGFGQFLLPLVVVDAVIFFLVVLLGSAVLTETNGAIKQTNYRYQKYAFISGIVLMIITYIVVYLSLSNGKGV